MPFLMLAVSTATARDVDDTDGRAKVGRDCETKAEEKPTRSSCNRQTIEKADMMMIVVYGDEQKEEDLRQWHCPKNKKYSPCP
jgi:hypothetical protein